MRLPRPLQDIRTIKLLLTTAEAEARRGGDDLPGPEHLLLSALELPDGTARRAFERIGVDPGGFRAAIEAAHRAALQGIGLAAPDGLADAAPPAPATGPYRLTAPGQEVFQRAVKLSKATKPSLLRGAHIVAAACEPEHGTVGRALTAIGVARDDLAAAARAEFAAA